MKNYSYAVSIMNMLLKSDLAKPESDSRMPLVVFGIVLDTCDPECLGRILVLLSSPSRDGKNGLYNTKCWARALYSNNCGKCRSFAPNIDDHVIVTFQEDVYDTPIIVGIIPKELHPVIISANDECEDIRSNAKINTGHGHHLFFDTNLFNHLEINIKSGRTITLNDCLESSKITISEENATQGNANVTVNMSDTQLSITTNKDLKIKARNIEIESEEMLSLKSTSTMTLIGSIVKIN